MPIDPNRPLTPPKPATPATPAAPAVPVVPATTEGVNEVGRFTGKTGAGILVLVLGTLLQVGGGTLPYIGPVVGPIADVVAPWLIALGGGLAGAGFVGKLQKIAAMVKAVADKLDG